MQDNRYINFVKPSSFTASPQVLSSLSGEDAKRIYLDEIKEAKIHFKSEAEYKTKNNITPDFKDVSKKDLFISAQNNDVISLKQMLDVCPDMLNITDDYDWSLLMIACQANSIDAVKELMKRGVDTSIRDKAGNSAQSLVIKNRNFVLAEVLLHHKSSESKRRKNVKRPKLHAKESYYCDVCNKEFPDKEMHLSSTVHNIDASKGKKIPSSFAIPATNKGFQIMLKVGWDKESGLGPDGSGNKYPIKTVQKQDRKGLGLDKRKTKIRENERECVRHVNRKVMEREFKSNRNMEINFRRQFY